ncbi:MAG: insulinase family protein [Deltaproteobacteria bacterium]|nr:insulinase family protein [Deltaproteobacteria bacterium]
MKNIDEFELLNQQDIPELNTRAFFYRHKQTSAEILSLVNDDENEVFGISFRTPPPDSTGLPHILEHSVLCGSRKYPVKEPFVELLKGSLQTFLNAMTYPDKTCYPVASQNVKDFYNLVDVYMDAVFYPRLTPHIFQQEGWHYELEQEKDPLIYKGVVFNEMKGAYSSPDTLLAEYSLQSLFPDNAYGLDAGGDPGKIPNLTYDQFKAFHQMYYHPSNAKIFFYGNDDPDHRLFLMGEYLKDFTRMEIQSSIPLQQLFHRPKRFIRPYPSGNGEGEALKGFITINWMLCETIDKETNLALHLLEYILLGMPGSPLRKALIESNLGEGLTGQGLGSEIRQIYFSTGLKGIDLDNVDRIEILIIQTLKRLVENRIDPHTIEAAFNSIEFSLRENNTGSYPRGLVIMLRALTTWLYDNDPLALVAFEGPLQAVKSRYAADPLLFEKMIEKYFLDNPHRTTVILKPDTELTEKEKRAEEERLKKVRATMGPNALQEVIRSTEELKKLQQTPDPPGSLATIPRLKLSDLERVNKNIPIVSTLYGNTPILYHDLFTNGIVYLDMGLNLHVLPQKYLPYIHLFSHALLEMGTNKEDYVTLSQRISRKTGGISPSLYSSVVKDHQTASAWLFLRGKVMTARTEELLNIIKDLFLDVRLDNQERFRQIVLEVKAGLEQRLIPNGHQFVNLRLRSHFNEADWASEQMSGISYLFFLRNLAEAVEKQWPRVLNDLQTIHHHLINRNALLVNVTMDEAGWSHVRPQVDGFLADMPLSEVYPEKWSPFQLPGFEGMTIPSQVNYVGKGVNLYQNHYKFHGSVHVISRFLRNSWLWDRVRVQGGAYGAFCLFDRLSGTMTFVSYRDPNLLATLDIFDRSAKYLKELSLNDDERTKCIVGAIGDMDSYKLPDAKGYTSMVRYLSGETDEDRQRIREEVLGTTVSDFKAFSGVLDSVKNNGLVKILGSQSAIQETKTKRPDWLNVVKVM